MNNLKNEKQKKMLLVLPLIAIPFCTMFFWALGGGKAAQAKEGKSQLAGLNMQLPGANIKTDSTENKLSFYEQAEADSLKFRQARKDDPYYRGDTTKHPAAKDSLGLYDTSIVPKSYGSIGGNFSGHSFGGTNAMLAENERQISQKLALLNRQINQPAPTPQSLNYNNSPYTGNISDSQLNRLQAAMQKMNNAHANAPDPQMEQLSNMLDKIADIQDPGVAREKMKEESEKRRGQVFAVTTSRTDNTVSTLDNSQAATGFSRSGNGANGFYSLDDMAPADSQNTIEAVIAETQTLVNGATVKLRLVNDIYINGVLIPQNTFVFGTAGLSGERLGVKINSIRYRKSLFPVSLSVFDMDGLDGIYIPGAITRDVAKESADQSVQNLGLTTYDPSLGAQAASAGITAAKTLFSRKVRLVKVTVKAGYQVLLRDEKQKQLNQ